MQSFVGWSQISSRRSAQLLLFRHVAAVGGRMASAASAAITQPVYKAIEEKLVAAFHPTHLEIVNESHKHNVPLDSETHFKVVVVSDAFAAKAVVARHRLVHEVLAEPLSGPVHALSIVAKTPEQWQTMVAQGKAETEPSPSCRGGDGSLPKKNYL